MKNGDKTKFTARRHTLFLVATSITLLSTVSCTSISKPKNAEMFFHTRISPAGLKHFQTSMVTPRTVVITRAARRPEGQRAKARQRKKKTWSTEKVLLNELAIQIEDNQFCRKGYWILGKKLYGEKVFIRGECNDLATTDDKKRFPDTIQEW